MLYLELFSKPTLKLQPGNIETFGHKNVWGKGHKYMDGRTE